MGREGSKGWESTNVKNMSDGRSKGLARDSESLENNEEAIRGMGLTCSPANTVLCIPWENRLTLFLR